MKIFRRVFLLLLTISLCACSHVNFIYDNSPITNQSTTLSNNTYVEQREEKTEAYTYYELNVISTLKIRYGHSTNHEVVGRLPKQSKIRAYEKTNDDGYTWYRIGGNEWVANDGTWIDVSTYQTTDYDDVDIISGGFKITNAEQIQIYKEANEYSKVIGKLNKGTIIYAYDECFVDGYMWFEIGPNEWIKNENDNITYTK